MEQLLKDLNINLPGEYAEDGSYVVDIPDSSEFGKVYSKLEKSDIVEEVDDSTVLTLMDVSVLYRNDDYSINLLADIGENSYRLVVNEYK
jgi:hypothetical protein